MTPDERDAALYPQAIHHDGPLLGWFKPRKEARMPEHITETWTEDDGSEWGVYGFTCDTCGTPVLVTATTATWLNRETDFQQHRLREDGTVTCLGCAGEARHPDGGPAEEMGT